MKIISPLYEQYKKEIAHALKKELQIKNILQVPRIEKICVNIGMGSYLQRLNSKDFSFVEENVRLITGQKPIIRYSKMSVSNFKLREGQPIGASVTLRGQAAYNFIDKLIHVVYPRVRDFRGIPRNIFDTKGNCSIGFSDHTVFPEAVTPEDSRRIHGLQVTIVTSADNSEHAGMLLEKMKFPFRKKLSSQKKTE
ncbi:50S ribosomal protein L5 [Candidatus Gracilibacteria bacterium]|nr:50S ribosomal protein L5 [Candidatus Gracilibacteria bacterium]MCF7819101.1 50S ribosomal protein L5 [Candidatus Gracilibacteria bacterium]